MRNVIRNDRVRHDVVALRNTAGGLALNYFPANLWNKQILGSEGSYPIIAWVVATDSDSKSQRRSGRNRSGGGRHLIRCGGWMSLPEVVSKLYCCHRHYLFNFIIMQRLVSNAGILFGHFRRKFGLGLLADNVFRILVSGRMVQHIFWPPITPEVRVRISSFPPSKSKACYPPVAGFPYL
jgi:hypothetical protein